MILMLSPFFAPNVGGVETHLTDLCQYLAAENVPTTVLTYQPLVTSARGPFHERQGSVSIFRFPWPGFGLFNTLESRPALQFLYLFPGLALASFFFVLCRGYRIGAIHSHGVVAAVLGRILKAVFGIRLVVSTHAVYGWLYDLKTGLLPRVIQWVFAGSNAILTLAEKSRQELIGIGIAPEHVGRFTYWVDQAVFRPTAMGECRQRLRWRPGLTVLFVGRLIEPKGVRLLIELAESLPSIRFVLAGDGPLRNVVTKTADRLPNVVYAGRIDNSLLPAYYAAADILCVPSLYEEGFGRIIIEALSCGCPVVASNMGGIPEAVDATVGVLVEPRKEDFLRVLGHLQENPTRLEQLRAATRPFAEARYSIRNAAIIKDSYFVATAPRAVPCPPG